MYCKKCGNNIDNDSIYCSFCGIKQNTIIESHTTNINPETNTEHKIVNVNLSFGNRSIPFGNSSNKVKISKYDSSYQKETEATIFGVVVIIATFLIFGFGGNFISSNPTIAPIFSLLGLVFRIITTVWVVNIAGRQNRDKTGWGIFSFLLPSLSLIIIGLSRKIKKEGRNLINNDNVNQSAHINISKTQNQPDKEDFLGSPLYWTILLGIPIVIFLIALLVNRH